MPDPLKKYREEKEELMSPKKEQLNLRVSTETKRKVKELQKHFQSHVEMGRIYEGEVIDKAIEKMYKEYFTK